ncbi:hypothetical protein GCM10007082_08300 [Oceanisphaera arctica]|nr:hypothetical protein GCM10007082_08300 [Oceanisphaera arctica]
MDGVQCLCQPWVGQTGLTAPSLPGITEPAGVEYTGIKMKMPEQCCESVHIDTIGY